MSSSLSVHFCSAAIIKFFYLFSSSSICSSTRLSLLAAAFAALRSLKFIFLGTIKLILCQVSKTCVFDAAMDLSKEALERSIPEPSNEADSF